MVKAGKVRYIGISNCFAYQLAKANALAEKEGFVKFVSVQGHYNLIFREEEREMAPFCYEDNVQKKQKIEQRRKARLMCYFRLLKQNKHILPVTTK